MNPISRGIRNAFRNTIRTSALVVIIGLSIGLSLTMLVAQKAVDHKIASVKGNIGNTINVSAAGVMGFQGGGDPLSESDVDKLSSLSHVTSLDKAVSDQLRSSTSTRPDGTTSAANSSLQSAIDAGSLGRRFGGGGNDESGANRPMLVINGDAAFTPPVSAYGQTNVSKLNGTTLTIKSGKIIDGKADKAVALVGSDLATKNSLKVGSTFTAYDETITVAGIFDTGTSFGNNAVIFSLPTLQRLSDQAGNITSATITVDSVASIDSVVTKVKSTLGDEADITSSRDEVADAIAPLDNVKTVATFSLIGAVVAGAIIILLTMVMIVRERGHEIGVVKAIGGSNARIMSEFVIESLTLTILGAVIGLIIGITGGQPVTKMLVDSSSNNNATIQTATGPDAPITSTGRGPGGFGERLTRRFENNTTLRSIGDIKTQIGPSILLYGLGAAVLIAAAGSALAAGMIAKVRPATVMRTE